MPSFAQHFAGWRLKGSSLGTPQFILIPLIMLLVNHLQYFIHVFHKLDVLQDQIRMSRDVLDTFDYIIVGAGSAGCVVASRLSENGSVKILLLEAGGEPNPLHRIPILSAPLTNRPLINWQYYSVPQRNACLAFNNNSAAMPRGKSLGGCSNANFMIHLRGHPLDYDNWANLTGDDGWSYRNVLEFFKKSEDYQGEGDNEKYHSHGGPLHITESPYKGLTEVFLRAGEEAGYPRTDLNAEYSNGFSPIYSTLKNGLRQSTYTAFLHPAKHRPNLFIRKYSHVTQILFEEGDSNSAVGVSYFRHGKNQNAYAKKEVIISAGALNTPQILMLSGIGPRNQLGSFKIRVRSDRPGVGQYLTDHVAAPIGPFVVDPPMTLRSSRLLTLNSVNKFVRSRRGPFTTTGFQATAYVTSPLTSANTSGQSNWPDLQYFLMSVGPSVAEEKEANRMLNLKKGSYRAIYEQVYPHDSFTIVSVLSRPHSKGEATLQSLDPFVPLLFNPNYLNDSRDVSILVGGAKKAVNLVEGSKAFKEIGARMIQKPYTKCSHFEFKSDDYWECYHRHFTFSAYHHCCTAGMGREEDKMAVVDSKLRVIGTQRLRIVDASVMPELVSSNTNAPTIMIGEKGAQFIKESEGWSDKFKNKLIKM